MYLLDLIRLGSHDRGKRDLRKRAADGGAWGAALLGALFALSFCPVSAALFFGSLVPLALQHGSKVVLPVVYGFGTALPVALLALVATGGTKALAAAMKKVGTFEVWARRITGIVFLAVGTLPLGAVRLPERTGSARVAVRRSRTCRSATRTCSTQPSPFGRSPIGFGRAFVEDVVENGTGHLFELVREKRRRMS